MEKQKLNDELYERLNAELDRYKEWLLTLPPQEILEHADEYAVRADIVMEMTVLDLDSEKAQALLSSAAPLDAIYSEYEQSATNYMDIVRDCIEAAATSIVAGQQTTAESQQETL